MKSQNLKIKIKPLSVNEAWQGRRYKTDKHQQFKDEIYYLLLNETKYNFDFRMEIHYKFYINNISGTDVDNLIKLTQDGLVDSNVIKDDRLIYKITSEKFYAQKGEEEVDIFIKEYD